MITTCPKCSIIYEGGENCPLCGLRKHDNQVHDFIESKGSALVRELLVYLRNRETMEEQPATDVKCALGLTACAHGVMSYTSSGVRCTAKKGHYTEWERCAGVTIPAPEPAVSMVNSDGTYARGGAAPVDASSMAANIIH